MVILKNLIKKLLLNQIKSNHEDVLSIETTLFYSNQTGFMLVISSKVQMIETKL